MKHSNRLIVSALAIAGVLSVSSDAAVKVDHLGPNNSLVRVSGDSRYLLMPVQEDVDDAMVNILVNGDLDHTIRVRLAKNRIDYYVPLDLAPFGDAVVALDVLADHDRSSVREVQTDVCWSNFVQSDTFDTANREKYRPLFHHTPLYGWMNDPNGMFYKDCRWHLYYQWNPYGSRWQNMTWGHSSSADLVDWEHHPAAIEPNGLGTVFSGSCVVDTANTAGFGKETVVALYTSAGVSQTQSMAHSSDNGETFTVYPGNPVITLDSEARDPNMFWNDSTGEWVLLLAHALEHEMLVFTSPDLKEWTLQSGFGKGQGAQGGVWECPDLFELSTVDGVKKWVLLCNLNPGGPFGGSATQYFVGDFDGRKFVADTDSNGKIPTKWLDFGKDHYATVSWSNAPDDRRTVIGWMSNWQYADVVPTRQYRSANTLPRDLSLFKGGDGQFYVSVKPSPELDALRDKKLLSVRSKSLSAKSRSFALPVSGHGVCEIDITVDARSARKVVMTLSNSVGDSVVMEFDAQTSTFSMDRSKSGVVDFSNDFPAVTVAPTLRQSDKLSLRIFIDRSSIEAFDADGNFAMTNLLFPNEPYSELSVSARGGKGVISSLDIYSIKTSQR